MLGERELARFAAVEIGQDVGGTVRRMPTRASSMSEPAHIPVSSEISALSCSIGSGARSVIV
jgi:hypothetical protein